MNRCLSILFACLLLASHASAESSDVAAPPPLSPQVQNGIRFLTGGIGNQEQEKLRELDDDYNVRVALTRDDGAYLSNIHIAIEDRAGETLLETTTRGPILLAELAPGRYVMRASSEDRTTERRIIDVPKNRDPVRLYVALENTDQATK